MLQYINWWSDILTFMTSLCENLSAKKPEKKQSRIEELLHVTQQAQHLWHLSLFISNGQVRVKIVRSLFGIILNRSLMFNAHMNKLTASLALGLRIIQTKVYTLWGWRCSYLNITFHVLIHSKLISAVPAWQP